MLEKELQIDHLHPKHFHSVKRLRKSVQRIGLAHCVSQSYLIVDCDLLNCTVYTSLRQLSFLGRTVA